MGTILQADDLDDIAVAALLEAHLVAGGVDQCTRENVDSLINIERLSFHLTYPNCLIRRDTIPLIRDQDKYSTPTDVLEINGVMPIIYCMVRRNRSSDDGVVNYPLEPIPPSMWYVKAIVEKSNTRPTYAEGKNYVAYSSGELWVYPIPYYADNVIYSYRAIQGPLLADSTFDIRQEYKGRFVTAVANRIRSKLGLAVTTP